MTIPGPYHYTPIDSTIAEALGQFIAAWSDADVVLSFLLMELMTIGLTKRNPKIFTILYATSNIAIAGMGTHVKISIIKNFLPSRLPKERIKEAEKLLDKVEDIKKHRDYFAHATYGKHPKTGRFNALGAKIGRSNKRQEIYITPKYLNDLRISLHERMNDLFKFLQKHDVVQSISISEILSRLQMLNL